VRLLAVLFVALLPAFAQQVPAPPSEPVPAGLGLDAASIVGEPAGAPLTGEGLRARTRAVAEILRCPTCQGMSVAESPAEGARAMRGEVERMLAAGYSDEQTLDFFVASYGEFILLEPRREGANLALWVAPAGLGLGGVALIGIQIARRRRGPSAGARPGSTAGTEGGRDEPSSGEGTPGASDYRDAVEREVR
jgi:cytochrome c-type biogenesis protein CcmH